MKIAIVGAGLTGLTAGWELAKKGYIVEIFEKSADIGGLAGGFEFEGTSLEKAYHHIFKTDDYIIKLISELGLQGRLKWYPEKTAVYDGDKIYPFNGAIDLLRFKPLDLLSKIRLGLVKIWLEKDNNWRKYTNITAAKWMKKYCGRKAYEVIWEPLLKGKFYDYYDKISMAWMWSRIHTRANSDGFLGYLEGGFGQISRRLEEEVVKLGGKIKTNYELKIKNYELKKYDAVVDTGPSEEVEYLGFVNLIFSSKQNLSSFYWHNVNDKKAPFLCFIQQTNLVDKKFYEGKEVYYLGKYLPNEGGLMEKTDQQIKKIFFNYLKKMFPEFSENMVEKWRVFRFENAQHVVDTNYELKIKNYELGINVYRANYAMIFPEDRGMNLAVREGIRVADTIVQDLGKE